MVVHGRLRRSGWLGILLTALVAVGCDEGPDDRTPKGALVQFVEAMDEGARDPEALERAYRLLDPEARAALQARAERAESLAGREMAPWEMLVPSRFRLRVPLDGHDDLEERIDGDHAVVIVPGDDGEPRAEVPMVQEGDRWRVQLPIPPVTGP